MRLHQHPTFAKWFQRLLLRAWGVAAVSFVLTVTLPKQGYEYVVGIAASVFIITLVGTLAYLSYRVFHVPCPNCGVRCHTNKSCDQNEWVAQCHGCQIEWNLGIGTNTEI